MYVVDGVVDMKEKTFLDKSIKEIISDYKSRDLLPNEIAEMCFRRTNNLEEKFKVWNIFDGESLLAQSQLSENKILEGKDIRCLEGIPIGVKDIFNTQEFTTEMGSPIWKDFTAGNDSRVVFYLKQAGAIIPGKTVTAEFAVHTPGKTLNPHDTSKNPGTSSSGSAVAVALGMVPAAIGTQTAGSIVRPASYCGVYGCKPSFGLIPRTGMLKTTDSLDTIGYFVTHCEDLELLFDVLRVKGRDYPISNKILNDAKRQSKPSDRPWRVGFVKTHTWKYAEEYAQNSIIDFVKELEKVNNIEVDEIELPSKMSLAHEVHETIYNKSLAHYFKEEYKKSELVSTIMTNLIEKGMDTTLEQFNKAILIQEELEEEIDELLSSYDVILSLSTAGEAPSTNENERPDPALMWTLLHIPVVSVPKFISPNGLPFGIQICSRRYNDLLLFEFIKCLREMDLIPAGPNPLINL